MDISQSSPITLIRLINNQHDSMITLGATGVQLIKSKQMDQ